MTFRTFPKYAFVFILVPRLLWFREMKRNQHGFWMSLEWSNELRSTKLEVNHNPRISDGSWALTLGSWATDQNFIDRIQKHCPAGFRHS